MVVAAEGSRLNVTQLKQAVVTALEDAKGRDIRELDVRPLTDITDWMILVSGTSSRHVLALADSVRTQVKRHDIAPLSSEGESTGDWVLLDYGDVVVHVMLPDARSFYDLEGLWDDRLGRMGQLKREGQSDS